MELNQSFYYVLNYKPILKNIKVINNNVIYCKNFFLFFLLFDFIKRNKKISNVKINVNKKTYFSQSFLRAPNKYKKAQIKINLIRYKVLFNCKFNYILNKSIFFELNFLNYFLNYTLNYFFFFESSFFFLERKNIKIKLNNHILLNYFFEI